MALNDRYAVRSNVRFRVYRVGRLSAPRRRSEDDADNRAKPFAVPALLRLQRLVLTSSNAGSISSLGKIGPVHPAAIGALGLGAEGAFAVAGGKSDTRVDHALGFGGSFDFGEETFNIFG